MKTFAFEIGLIGLSVLLFVGEGLNSEALDKPTYHILASYSDWVLWKWNKIVVPPSLLNRVKSLVLVGKEGINSIAFNKPTYQILGSY